MYSFLVEGISCEKCAATITQAVRALDGTARVEVSIPGQKVEVESGLPPHVVERAIVDAGYPVREMRH